MGIVTPTTTALSIIASVITIGAYGRAKRAEFRDTRRDRLVTLINRGLDYHSLPDTSRGDLHRFALDQHRQTINKESYELKVVDSEYFKDRIPKYFDQTEGDECLQFPSMYRSEWLRSNNEKFDIQLGALDQTDDGYTVLNNDHPVGGRFLKKYGISKSDSGDTYDDFFDFVEQECNVELWDAPTYDLTNVIVDDDGTLRLECSLGWYRYYMQVYKAIQQELFYQFVFEEGVGPRVVDPLDFILRDELINFSQFDSYENRPVKIGLSVFMILSDSDGGHNTILHRRQDDVAEQPNFYHVVPAGTFQPHMEHNMSAQYSLEYSIFRELFEEIFSVGEARGKADRPGIYDSFDIKVTDKNGETISIGNQLFGEEFNQIPSETAAYEIIPTGVVVDILSFKIDVTFVLHIKDSDLHDLILNNAESGWEGQLGKYSIGGDKFTPLSTGLRRHLNADEFLPNGAVAVAEGLTWYHDKLA